MTGFRGDKKKHLECISSAIDSIADGDLVDRRIRSNQNWSLLPLQVSVHVYIRVDMGFRRKLGVQTESYVNYYNHGPHCTGKVATTKYLSGKTQGIWKFCQNTGKTQGILYA